MNQFAMMGGMPGLAGLMGMGGGLGPGLNSSQVSSMWGGVPGGRGMGAMGFNRGMMEQVRHRGPVEVSPISLTVVTSD